tara:strand:- start:1686 stop:2966 length:1281 start_codon:yes stop_codon:yes gene_type:complete
MAVPTLTPASQMSKVILPVTGNPEDVSGSLAFGVYSGVEEFLSGAAAQVEYTYRKLGGEILDIELSASNVYASYEEACLEYSYIVNIHQSKNIMGDALGSQTGSFDHLGNLDEGPENVNLKYPRFSFSYAKRVASALSEEAGVGGNTTFYSASFARVAKQQDYDLQRLIYTASVDNSDPATDSGVAFAGLIDGDTGNKKVNISKVYYKTPQAMWRFYGYYGGIGVVGNMNTYGQYSDDSTFEVIPAWQNKMQAMAYEDSIYTRVSHYSYELRNNRLRLYPVPDEWSPEYFWVEFTIPTDIWDESDDIDYGISGVNNMNSLPFDNIPYNNINSIGKQWIRRFALALAKETLGQVRSKFGAIPIPGESVTLNGEALITQGKEEQEKLRTELKEVLVELEYDELLKSDVELVEAASKIFQATPLPIFVG